MCAESYRLAFSCVCVLLWLFVRTQRGCEQTLWGRWMFCLCALWGCGGDGITHSPVWPYTLKERDGPRENPLTTFTRTCWAGLIWVHLKKKRKYTLMLFALWTGLKLSIDLKCRVLGIYSSETLHQGGCTAIAYVASSDWIRAGNRGDSCPHSSPIPLESILLSFLNLSRQIKLCHASKPFRSL